MDIKSKMDLKTTVCCLLLMGLQQESESANVKNCDGDHNCPEGYYCYREAMTCAPCTNCSSYFRAPSKWNKCVKHPKHCGECLPEYEEEILTEGRVRDLCVLAPSKNPKDAKDEGFSVSSRWWIVMPVLLVIGSLSGVWYQVYGKKRGKPPRRTDMENNGSEDFYHCDQPPPYSYPRHSGSSSHCSTPESSSAPSSARNSGHDCPIAVMCHPFLPEPSAPPQSRAPSLSSKRNSGADNLECQNLLNEAMTAGETHNFLGTYDNVAPICLEEETKQTTVPYALPNYMLEENEQLPAEEGMSNNNEIREPEEVIDQTGEVNNNVRIEDEAIPGTSTSYAQEDSSEGTVRSDGEDPPDETREPNRKKRKTQAIHINLSQTLFLQNENFNINNS